jgi:hypothetical protein
MSWGYSHMQFRWFCANSYLYFAEVTEIGIIQSILFIFFLILQMYRLMNHTELWSILPSRGT